MENYRSEASLIFELKNFSKLEFGVYSSEMYQVRNLPWQIFVRFKLIEEKKYIGIYLKCAYTCDNDWSCTVDRKTKLINYENSLATIVVSHERRDFSSEECCRGIDKFARYKYITDPKNGFIRDDTVKIVIDLKVDFPWHYEWSKEDLFGLLKEFSKENISAGTEAQVKRKLRLVCDIYTKYEKGFNDFIVDIKSVKRELENVKKNNQEEKKLYKETKKKNKELTDEVSKLKENLSKLENEKQNMKKEIDGLKKEKKSMKSSSSKEGGSLLFIEIKDTDKYIITPKKFLQENCPKLIQGASLNEDNKREELLLDIRFETITEMLAFIYSATVTERPERLWDLIEAAKNYDIGNLYKICDTKIMEALTISNSIDMLLRANSKDLQDVKSKIIEFMKTNLKEIKKTKNWEQFSTFYTDLSKEVVGEEEQLSES